MPRTRALLSTLLLAAALPASAHDVTLGGSRWCLARDGIVATIDLDSSLLSRIGGIGAADRDLESRSETELKEIAGAVLQPYVDARLTVRVNGAAWPARVDRLAKAGGVWQIGLSMDGAALDRPSNSVELDYRLLLEETGGAHVNIAYLYLSQEGTAAAQRIFDFAQPTWQTMFKRGATAWRATIPGAPAAAAAPLVARATTPLPSGPGRGTPVRSRTPKAPSPAPGGGSGRGSADAVATPAPTATPDALPPAAAQQLPPGESRWARVGRFVLLGIEHILTGYDHIAFLLALVVVTPSLGAVLPIITAFTAAHSITLLLAALRIVAIDSRIVESAIALSICYVAVENLFRKRAAHRWLVTFAFGLVHGFGFASVLQELVVGKAGLVASVVAFNVGVELGQILIFALMLPVLGLLGKLAEPRKVAVVASAAIGLLGCTWVLERSLAFKLLPS
jgi:hypothetical protein